MGVLEGPYEGLLDMRDACGPCGGVDASFNFDDPWYTIRSKTSRSCPNIKLSV